jgi:hypothetical protein
VLQVLLSLAPWGVTSFIGTFGSYGSLGRERESTFANGAFASTSITQVFTFGKLAKKMKKEVDINKALKNEWVAQFPRVEAMVDLTCEIHMLH